MASESTQEMGPSVVTDDDDRLVKVIGAELLRQQLMENTSVRPTAWAGQHHPDIAGYTARNWRSERKRAQNIVDALREAGVVVSREKPEDPRFSGS